MKKTFEKLIATHSTSLTKLCTSLCNNLHDAQDLYQATWEKAIKKYRQYDSNQSFEKWLFAICVNTYRDMLRRYDNKKVVKFSTSDEQESFLSSIPDFDVDKDEYIALHTALANLRPEHREVIILYYFKDYSILELSEILSVKEGTVKSRLHFAREKIRKEMHIDEKQ